jgi:hypothetical protein
MKIYRYQYILIITIPFLFYSCDFTKRKVKGGVNKIAHEAGELVDEFLTLPDRTVKRDILDSELYGDWILTGQSLKYINRQKTDYPDWESITYPSLRFELNEDKTVKAWIYEKYLPISFFKYPVTVNDSVLISGKWTISKDLYSTDTISTFKNKLYLDFNINAIVTLNIAETDGKLILWSYIGDPDNLYYQEYKR